jgi:hypothetical protein
MLQSLPICVDLKEAFGPASWSNWALFGAAVFAGCVALQTLKKIKTQADLMGSQVDLMRQQNEMILSKERGRINVELENFSPKQHDFLGFLVQASVSNRGPTDVTVNASEFWAVIDDPKKPTEQQLSPQPTGLPRLIGANSTPLSIMAPLMRNDSLQAGDEGISDVLSGEKMVYCRGRIIYTDIFDRKHMVRISKRYRIFQPSMERGDFFGWWEDYGETADVDGDVGGSTGRMTPD